MAELELVKMSSGGVRGYTQDDEAKRQKWHAFVDRLEPGEFFSVKYWQVPDPVLHRRLMALFRLLFEHFEPERARKRLTFKGRPIEKDFDRFRKDLTIRAGFYEASFDSRNRVHLEAESLEYGKMSDERKRALFEALVTIGVQDILTNYNREDVAEVIAKIQEFGQ